MNHQTVLRADPATFMPSDGRLVRWGAMDGVLAFVAGTIRAAVRRSRRRRAEGELRSLNDRVLKDIGVHRSEILSVVNTGAIERKVRRHAHD